MKTIWIIFSIVWFIIWVSYFMNNMENKEGIKTKQVNMDNLKTVYFAGGCFWCMEWIFESQEWVSEAIVWYVWGEKQTANYVTVSSWITKHREWIKVVYDPNIISYSKLVELYWTQIDPTDPNWQFADDFNILLLCIIVMIKKKTY